MAPDVVGASCIERPVGATPCHLPEWVPVPRKRATPVSSSATSPTTPVANRDGGAEMLERRSKLRGKPLRANSIRPIEVSAIDDVVDKAPDGYLRVSHLVYPFRL